MSSPYAPLLRSAPIRHQALAGVGAQLTQGAASLGMILLIREATGSLSAAGTTVAAFNIGAGIARPVQGRMIDRRGVAGIVATSGAVHAAALIALVAAADFHAPVAAFIALGLLAGLALPPISASMRVVWARLTGGMDRTAAYSLITLTQDLTVLLGPLLLAALIAAGSRSLAIIVIAGISAAGTLGFALSAHAIHLPVSNTRPRRDGVLRSPGMRLVVVIHALLGATLGALELAVAALATAHRAPAATGLLFAALSVGGILGGVVYGSRRWQASIGSRLVAVLGLLTVAVAALIATHSLVLAAALLLAGGLAINPTLTTNALLVDRHVPAHAAEAFGWLSTALSAGIGAGSGIAGAVGQSTSGATGTFAVAAIASACALALAVVTRSRLDGPDGDDAAAPEPGVAYTADTAVAK